MEIKSYLPELLLLRSVQIKEWAAVSPWVLTAAQTKEVTLQSSLNSYGGGCSASLCFSLAVYMPHYSTNVVIF